MNTIISTDINECPANPCNTNAMCFDTHGSYVCSCNDGFMGDGNLCQSNTFFIHGITMFMSDLLTKINS